MTDVPMLFSAPMVRALLAGTKTQTRRLRGVPTIEVLDNGKWHVHNKHGGAVLVTDAPEFEMCAVAADYLPIQPRDRIWVRETLAKQTAASGIEFAGYAVDGRHVEHTGSGWPFKRKSVPSIHMPRTFSRLTLIVTEARVQRLQDISEEDSRAEGVEEATCYQQLKSIAHPVNPPLSGPHWRLGYERLWDKINGKTAPWVSNPWVAAYTFAVHRCNIDEAPK